SPNTDRSRHARQRVDHRSSDIFDCRTACRRAVVASWLIPTAVLRCLTSSSTRQVAPQNPPCACPARAQLPVETASLDEKPNICKTLLSCPKLSRSSQVHFLDAVILVEQLNQYKADPTRVSANRENCRPAHPPHSIETCSFQ